MVSTILRECLQYCLYIWIYRQYSNKDKDNLPISFVYNWSSKLRENFHCYHLKTCKYLWKWFLMTTFKCLLNMNSEWWNKMCLNEVQSLVKLHCVTIWQTWNAYENEFCFIELSNQKLLTIRETVEFACFNFPDIFVDQLWYNRHMEVLLFGGNYLQWIFEKSQFCFAP